MMGLAEILGRPRVWRYPLSSSRPAVPMRGLMQRSTRTCWWTPQESASTFLQVTIIIDSCLDLVVQFKKWCSSDVGPAAAALQTWTTATTLVCRHPEEHLLYRRALVSIRCAEVWPEVRLLDSQRLAAGPANDRRGHLYLHPQRGVGPCW